MIEQAQELSSPERVGVRPASALKLPALPESLLGAILPAILFVVWELASRAGLVRPNWLPAPTSIAQTLYELAIGGELLPHVATTTVRVAVGFALGAALATLLGALAGYVGLARKLLDPLIQALRNIPSMAWVPLFLLWLGVGESSKITLIAVGAFFPVYLNLVSGILHVDPKLVEVGRMFELRGVELIRRVILPATFPNYVIGLRSGLGLGWMFVVAAELMGASKGVGFLMVDGQMTGRAGVIIASILLFAVLGKLSDWALERAGQRLQPGGSV